MNKIRAKITVWILGGLVILLIVFMGGMTLYSFYAALTMGVWYGV